MQVVSFIAMPNEKSKILNKKKTLLIVLGVLLALLITLKSDQLFSYNVSTPVTKQGTFLKTDQSVSTLIHKFKSITTTFYQAKSRIQGLQN